MPKQVRITINTNAPAPLATPGPAAFSISVDEDPIQMLGQPQGNGAFIHWDIQTSGWTFAPANAIEIHNPGNKFTDKGGANQGRRHTWQREQADGAQYKYTIRVTNGTVTVAWDPWIVNR